jgi:uncharacterized heparinase superfamily protein
VRSLDVTYHLQDFGSDLGKMLARTPAENLRRLSGRTARYLRRVRSRRQARRFTDRDLLGALAEPVASIGELLQRRQSSPPLLPGAARAAQTARLLAARAPQTLTPIVAAAERLRGGVWELLGSGPVTLGPLPDWRTDFKSGHRFGRRSCRPEDLLAQRDRGADVKVPWELGRLQHLSTLGLASIATGDPAYRELALAQARSFLQSNPAYDGVQWSCTMDVALRAAGLLCAEGLLRAERPEPAGTVLLKALLSHGRFIRDNLEDGPVRGNHYLADVAGLYLCGLGLPEYREAAAWRAFARAALEREMEHQVGSDGFDFESSTSYHALATEMFLFPALLAQGRDTPFPDHYLRRLRAMLQAVATLLREDGSLPQIGDNDDGRFVILSQYHRGRRDWRPLLGLGAALFRDPQWLRLAGDAWVEAAWAAGPEIIEWAAPHLADAPTVARSAAFPHAGLYQLAAGPLRLVVDAGGVGQDGQGGHAHNDDLAFDLHAQGEELLPDRGTGVYTPDLRLRDRLRSTAAHNTLRIDGEEIHPLGVDPFTLPAAEAPRVRRWRAGPRFTYLAIEQPAYRRLPAPALHRRRILLDARRQLIRIEDRVEGTGRHRFELAFHLAPGWSAAIGEEGFVATRPGGGPGLRLQWLRRPPQTRVEIEETRHSPSYGVLLAARVVLLRWEGTAPCAVRYQMLLLPEGNGTSPGGRS